MGQQSVGFVWPSQIYNRNVSAHTRTSSQAGLNVNCMFVNAECSLTFMRALKWCPEERLRCLFLTRLLVNNYQILKFQQVLDLKPEKEHL